MKHQLLVLFASLTLISCGSNDSPRTVCTDYSLEIVEQSSPPLIDKNHPGSAGNRQGYEGGTVFIKDGTYQMFVTEEINGWVGTRTGYWRSNDGVTWERISTIMESVNTPDDSRNAVWSPMPFYNGNEGRWNMFYVGYEARGSWNGRIFRAVSETVGKDGLAGPYTDVPGTVLSYTDSSKHPWEGRQGAAAFYVYRAGQKWYGFYASGDSRTRWDEGLALADSLEGRWRRDDNPNPVLTYAENPIVVQLEDGAFFCVFDDIAHGEFSDNAITRESSSTIGYAFSVDGVHWSQRFLNMPKPSWASNIRTPQSFVSIGGDQYWVYFTANTPEGFDCVARIKVRLVKKQISPEHAQ
jgi:hypothetical protein